MQPVVSLHILTIHVNLVCLDYAACRLVTHVNYTCQSYLLRLVADQPTDHLPLDLSSFVECAKLCNVINEKVSLAIDGG